jgi:hypothetical protein
MGRLLLSTYLFVCVLVISQVIKADIELQRIDCYPEAPYSFGQPISTPCAARNCVYKTSTKPNVPWCFYPQDSFGYTMTNSVLTPRGYKIFLKRLTTYPSPYPDPINDLVLEADYLNSKIFRVKIYDPANQRYEVPIQLNDIKDDNYVASDFRFTFGNKANDSVFNFQIIRKSNNVVLFDTSIGGLFLKKN